MRKSRLWIDMLTRNDAAGMVLSSFSPYWYSVTQNHSLRSRDRTTAIKISYGTRHGVKSKQKWKINFHLLCTGANVYIQDLILAIQVDWTLEPSIIRNPTKIRIRILQQSVTHSENRDCIITGLCVAPETHAEREISVSVKLNAWPL
jgi:hypothetical protein